jgi:hypothetical protein
VNFLDYKAKMDDNVAEGRRPGGTKEGGAAIQSPVEGYHLRNSRARNKMSLCK